MDNRIFLLSLPIGCISLCNSVSLFLYHYNNSFRLRHKNPLSQRNITFITKFVNKIKQHNTTNTTQHNTAQHNTRNTAQFALHQSCCFMCETGTIMKDCKGMLITQICKNMQTVMAVAFFGRNCMNETALRYKRIPFFYCNTRVPATLLLWNSIM
jgi:hypothetical protein